jgi:hypothetical protein
MSYLATSYSMVYKTFTYFTEKLVIFTINKKSVMKSVLLKTFFEYESNDIDFLNIYLTFY